MWESTSTPVPDFASRGAIPFDDPASSTIFDAFHRWAQSVSAGSHPDRESLGVRDFRLQASILEDPLRAPGGALGASAPCWVAPSRYVVSDALLDGFFTGRNWVGDIGDKTIARRGWWTELSDRFADSNGAFSPSRTRSTIHAEGIEMARGSDSEFFHTNGLGGRHRTVAMLMLGVPALPAMVYSVGDASRG